MKNPNRYGTISKLSGNRRKPYQVREGTSGKQKVIACCATKEEALQVLAKYNESPWDIDAQNITVQGVYEEWLKGNALRLSEATRRAYKSAYKHYLISMANVPYRAVKAYHMKRTIEQCEDGASQKNAIRTVWTHLDRQALEMDVISKAYSQLLVSVGVPKASKSIFTKEEIQTIWDHRDDENVYLALILLYTGMRISELHQMRKENVNLEEWYMVGGVKTSAGKDRIIPIHPHIRDIIEKLYLSNDTDYLIPQAMGSITTMRRDFQTAMEKLGISHNPHECRHTFRTALDETNASRVSINKIMGHSNGNVGEDVYTHKSLEALIETIQCLDYGVSL